MRRGWYPPLSLGGVSTASAFESLTEPKSVTKDPAYALLFDCDGVIVLTEELHRKAYNGAFEHFNLKIKGEPVVWTVDYYDVLQVTCGRQWVPRDVLDSEGGQRQFSTVANEIVDGCKSGWEAISGGKKPFAEIWLAEKLRFRGFPRRPPGTLALLLGDNGRQRLVTMGVRVPHGEPCSTNHALLPGLIAPQKCTVVGKGWLAYSDLWALIRTLVSGPLRGEAVGRAGLTGDPFPPFGLSSGWALPLLPQSSLQDSRIVPQWTRYTGSRTVDASHLQLPCERITGSPPLTTSAP